MSLSIIPIVKVQIMVGGNMTLIQEKYITAMVDGMIIDIIQKKR